MTTHCALNKRFTLTKCVKRPNSTKINAIRFISIASGYSVRACESVTSIATASLPNEKKLKNNFQKCHLVLSIENDTSRNKWKMVKLLLKKLDGFYMFALNVAIFISGLKNVWNYVKFKFEKWKWKIFHEFIICMCFLYVNCVNGVTYISVLCKLVTFSHISHPHFRSFCFSSKFGL